MCCRWRHRCQRDMSMMERSINGDWCTCVEKRERESEGYLIVGRLQQHKLLTPSSSRWVHIILSNAFVHNFPPLSPLVLCSIPKNIVHLLLKLYVSSLALCMQASQGTIGRFIWGVWRNAGSHLSLYKSLRSSTGVIGNSWLFISEHIICYFGTSKHFRCILGGILIRAVL